MAMPSSEADLQDDLRTQGELGVVDSPDWLNERDCAALHQALRDSEEDVKAGRIVDADAVLRELRSLKQRRND